MPFKKLEGSLSLSTKSKKRYFFNNECFLNNLFPDLPQSVTVGPIVHQMAQRWPPTPSNSPIEFSHNEQIGQNGQNGQNDQNDMLPVNNQSMLDYLSNLELPPDLDSNQINNNFDADPTMDVDQDVADWLDSLLPTTTHNNKHRTDSSMELHSNCFSNSTHNSDPLLVGGIHPNNIFMLDDADMCSNSIWDQ